MCAQTIAEPLSAGIQFCQRGSVSRAELRQWMQCQQDINRYWDELFERSCLRVLDYMSIAREQYGFTFQCFVGRPNAPMMYFRK